MDMIVISSEDYMKHVKANCALKVDIFIQEQSVIIFTTVL